MARKNDINFGRTIVEAERRTDKSLKGKPGLPPRQPTTDTPAEAEPNTNSVKPVDKRPM